MHNSKIIVQFQCFNAQAHQSKKSIINKINSNQKQLNDWNGWFNETQKGLKGMLSLDQQASVSHLKLLTLMVLLPTQLYTCKWLSSLYTLHIDCSSLLVCGRQQKGNKANMKMIRIWEKTQEITAGRPKPLAFLFMHYLH